MVIAVDFDGTCVTHDFPRVGKEIGAVPVLKRLVEEGHKLILWTMRSDVENPTSDDPTIIAKGGKYLSDAVKWFTKHGIALYGVQRNPTQDSWTHSPKCYAEMYIDDAALGCPLSDWNKLSDRPFVDWVTVEEELISKGILPYRSGI
jgi:hypothetical protein